MELIYKGKSKDVYSTDDASLVILECKDDITAGNGVKSDKLAGKGATACMFTKNIFRLLENKGLETHIVEYISDTKYLAKKLDMIQVEFVVRNYSAGSFAKNFGVKYGEKLKNPLVEYFLKSDTLNDPIMSENHILHFGYLDRATIDTLTKRSLAINEILVDFFDKGNFLLVDFKLEYGYTSDGKLVLADEFSPDNCRIWDKHTLEKFDKDRFRQDLGGVLEHYKMVAARLGMTDV